MDAARLERLRLLQQELERRKALKSAPPPSIGHIDPVKQQRLEALKAELARRHAMHQQELEYTYGERAGQVARGAATTYGALGDLPYAAKEGVKKTAAYKDVAKPLYDELLESVVRISKPEDVAAIRERQEELARQEQEPRQPLAEILPGYIDKLYGKDLSPKDAWGKFLHGAGEVGAPVPIPGVGGYVQAAKSGVLPFIKHLGKEASMAAGASTAINFTPQFAEEGTWGAAAENIIKGLVGAKAGSALPGAAKNVAQTIRHPIEFGAAKIGSKFIKPDEAILETAARHGIELPFNVGSNSTPANYVANNYLKSVFSSKEYKNALRRASDSMINAVRRNIDTLGEANVSPGFGSNELRARLKEQESVLKRQADMMFENARELLRQSDAIVPNRTLRALQSEPVQELMSTISPSTGERAVINRIREISGRISGGGPQPPITIGGQRISAGQYQNNPRLLEAMRTGSNRNGAVPVSDLINLRKSLLNTLDYETDIRGSEAFLSRLVKTLDEDINTVSNAEALRQYRNANQFFRQNIGETFRSSIGKSLLRNEAPVEAYNLLNTPENVRILDRIVGRDPRGKELLDSLKKAKVREILGSSVEGNLATGEGSVRTAPFAKLFQKGEKRQDLLYELIGHSQYNNLCEISTIANEFSKSGRELLNTSGTAHVLSDINAGKDVAKETIKSVAWLLGGGSAGGVGGLAIAGSAVASPYAVSRLVANPRFVSQARAYAIARQAGKEGRANMLLRPLIITAARELQKEKEEE